MGKIRSTRFEGMSDMRRRPPKIQQTSHTISGEARRHQAGIPIFSERTFRTVSAMRRMLQGPNL
jgi:hypothetical protein